MPRYDDRYYDRYDRYDLYGGNTKLYMGRLSTCTRTQDVEHLFSRYGRNLAIPGMQMMQGMNLMAERLMGAASLLSMQEGGSPSPMRDGRDVSHEEKLSPGRNDRGVGGEERQPRNSSYSPRRNASPSSYDRILTPNGMSHPPNERAQRHGSYHSARGDSWSLARDSRPATNGRSLSPW